jgi:tRNA/rRNA methyltransferase
MKPLDLVRIVLVRPVYGGNVGSVCRAMKNMGLSRLVVVGPEDHLDLRELRAMAVHAHDLYEGRGRAATLEEAVADCGLVAATTARPGLYREHSLTPREAAPRLLEAAADTPVALVFGPEDDGLSNEDIARCSILLRIPSSPDYASLNLAMSVMVCAYELFAAAGTYQPPSERTPEAPAEMKERLFDFWRQMLLDIGFMQEMKADHMMLGFKRAFSRGPMSVADVRILMGVVRQTLWMASQYRKYKALARPGAES